jgi:signal transduction histidine kinase
VIAIENARLFHALRDKSRQLELASRHKSEFLANMSHELRTPLNSVIGFSEVLKTGMVGPLNEKQADYVSDILEAGEHLLALINDVLDLSKVEAGRMELNVSRFDLSTELARAVSTVRERAVRHGIELRVEAGPGLDDFNGDKRKIKQILLNLLSNAVKFTPDGGRIELRAARTDRWVEIAVRDSGPGISAEDQATLFREFSQVGSDAARKAEGTGLGLALTRRLVELHGDGPAVESAPGEGATFRVTLPG